MRARGVWLLLALPFLLANGGHLPPLTTGWPEVVPRGDGGQGTMCFALFPVRATSEQGGSSAVSYLRVRLQRRATAAPATTFSPFARSGPCRGKAFVKTWDSSKVAGTAQLSDSTWPSSINDEDGNNGIDGFEPTQTGEWTKALDARGNPLRIEAANGAAPRLDESDEIDSQVEADEEFEFGFWTPPSSSLDQRNNRNETPFFSTSQRDIKNWRDGEMESELGRLEMSVYEDRVPSLVQMNRAMHLCCKAVYKGLGHAGLSKGLRVLNLMWSYGVVPNNRSFDLLLDASIGAAAQGQKEALFIAMTIVFNMCDLGVVPRVILVNQLIKQVLKSSGNSESDFKLALMLVDAASHAGVRLDIYTFNSLLAATALQTDGGSTCSLSVMARMRRNNVKPDIVTYNAFLHTCAKGSHKYGYQLVRRGWRMLRVLRSQPRGLRPSVISYNTVAHACARAASAAPAHTMRQLDSKDLAMFRSAFSKDEYSAKQLSTETASAEGKIAAAYARGRMLEEMMTVVYMMKKDKVKPDLRSFSTLFHGLARGIDRMVNDVISIPSHHGRSHGARDNSGRIRRQRSARSASFAASQVDQDGVGMCSAIRQHVVGQVDRLCSSAEETLLAMQHDYAMQPEPQNYRAVLDMYRSAARLGEGERDWPAAASWLLSTMRKTAGGKVAESAYTDVLEICAAVAGDLPPTPIFFPCPYV